MNMSKPDVTQGSITRPGLKSGRSNEFTLLARLKPGGAERLRSKLGPDTFRDQNQPLVDRLGTVHDLRYLIIDNDTRLLFMSTFDGDWDAYINDFASTIPDPIDMIFGEAEGFPGIHSPDVKDWIVEHQLSATYFYSAYPNASVRDIWKSLKIEGGLDVILDAASS
jgi:hypothetical protein